MMEFIVFRHSNSSGEWNILKNQVVHIAQSHKKQSLVYPHMATRINALFYHCHIKTVEGDREMELKIRAHHGFGAVA